MAIEYFNEKKTCSQTVRNVIFPDTWQTGFNMRTKHKFQYNHFYWAKMS